MVKFKKLKREKNRPIFQKWKFQEGYKWKHRKQRKQHTNTRVNRHELLALIFNRGAMNLIIFNNAKTKADLRFT